MVRGEAGQCSSVLATASLIISPPQFANCDPAACIGRSRHDMIRHYKAATPQNNGRQA